MREEVTLIEPAIFGLCFASRLLPGPSLPESVIHEAEAAWGEVVATVNSVHPSHSLESQFYPLFAERVTEPLMIEGKNFRSLLTFWPGCIVCIFS